MLAVAPPGFSLKDALTGIYTFQQWEVFPGHVTQGAKNVLRVMERGRVPLDLTGMRVLDIAPWNGFFSFECIRRGATEVVSLGPEDPERSGYNRVRNLLAIENATFVQGSVYDLPNLVDPGFDLIFCLGLLYHLRHPLFALDRIHDVMRRHSGQATAQLVLDCPVIGDLVPIRNLGTEAETRVRQAWQSTLEIPMLYFTPGAETGDPFNWFYPNLSALEAMVASSGFAVQSSEMTGHWCTMSATVTDRPFADGLEGFNPGYVRFPPNN